MVEPAEAGREMRSGLATSQHKPGKFAILVVDDEPALRKLLMLSLTRIGYDVTEATNGQEALAEFARRPHDLVLLDVMMPDLDGLNACRQLRQRSDVPIIMLTGLSQTADIVAGLNLGADAYITKPFVFKELEAHVAALLRRVGKQRTPDQVSSQAAGDLILQNESRQATVGDRQISLTKLEFELVAFLVQNAGRAVSKEELLRSVWGYDVTSSDNIVELAVRRVRQKIERDPSNPERLITVRGVGYLLTNEPHAANPIPLSHPGVASSPGQSAGVQHRASNIGPPPDRRMNG